MTIVRGISIHTLLITNLFAVSACGRGQAPASAPPAPLPEVTVSRAVERPVVEWDIYTGRVDAVETVDVRARVSGYLDAVRFRDGSRVQAGEVLYVIDQRPYQAALAQADAAIESANARLEVASSEARRAQRLSRQGVMPAEEAEQRQGELRNTQASLESARAARESARLNLEFTEIRAPIGGRIDRTFVTKGNLIRADDTLLTTIVSVDPMYVYLDVDERNVLKYRKLAREGKRKSARDGAIPARLQLADGTEYPYIGHTDFVKPRFDAATGTTIGRTVFPNPEDLLSAGMFGRILIPGGPEYRAVLMSERAIGSDQGRKFVWVVKDDNKVEYRPVELGRLIEGFRVITAGLRAGEQVIVEGQQKARPDVTVVPSEEPLKVPEIGLGRVADLEVSSPGSAGAPADPAPRTEQRP
ncbi:MAG: efflux RND transporter periplasmic adaptor subunit [Chromatiales bacterium]